MIVSDGIAFPESPRWRNGLLWFSDVHNYCLRACDETGRLVESIAVPERPAGLGFLHDGTLLMATAEGRRLYRVAGSTEARRLDLVCDVSAHCYGLLNDMIVDRAGRAYVGETGFNLATGESFRPGRIFLVDDAGAATIVAEGLHFPNGMAITPDATTLLVAESFAGRIAAFRIAADGTLHDRRIHCEVDAVPDGIALNADGTLWIGDYRGGRFLRVASDGSVTGEIAAGAEHGIACGWGGDEQATLYLCAATRRPDGSYAGTIRGVSEASIR